MKTTIAVSSLALPLLALAQNVVVPDTCVNGTMPANDEVIVTLPYTYSQVLSIIGSYKNLTWSGSPDDTVTLNGTDNTVGTARTYDIAGAHVIETILTYDSPPNGPYYENHNVAPLVVPTPNGNVSLYCQLDATTVTSVCGGAATMFNFTAGCCSNNSTAASAILHMLHENDALTVGKFLGGKNYTGCPANASSTATGAPAQYTGAAATWSGSLSLVVGVFAGLSVLM